MIVEPGSGAGRDHVHGARHRHRHRRGRAGAHLRASSSRRTAARRAGSAAPASASRSRSASSSAWADASASRAGPAPDRPSPFTVPLARAGGFGRAAFAAPNLDGLAVLMVAASPFEVPLAARAPRPLGRRRLRRRRRARAASAAGRAALRRPAGRSRARLRRGGSARARGARAVTRRIVLITPEQRLATAAPAGGGIHRLPGEADPCGLACRAFRGAARIPTRRSRPRAGTTWSAHLRRAGLSILVAEDNEINALLARSLLVKLGHRPTVVANGDAAIEAWRAARDAGTPFDLVLMDVQMPELDGLEATRRMRAAEAEAGCARERRSSRSPPTPLRKTARPASPPAWTTS